MTTASRRVLPTIVLAQLAGTSPWFAVNAVMPELQRLHGWSPAAVGQLSAALQWGFVAGTLVFALLALADRFSARRVFLLCALAASACTVVAAALAARFDALLLLRVATGFFLAGIYPVGMKLAAQWFPQGLGVALGWLVGALVLGSASPHGLRAWLGGAAAGAEVVWAVMLVVAALCAGAGLALVAVVPEPPGGRIDRSGQPGGLHLGVLASLWQVPKLRASAGGYFGHMVELYTLWVLMPLILATRLGSPTAVSGWAFVTLGLGALGCIGGGYLAQRGGGAAGTGSARVAALQLATSGLCCLLAPWLLLAPLPLFLAWLALWGCTVAGDSPQFSALTARNAPPQAVGSLLTLVNSIGFAISALSIALFVQLAQTMALASLLPWLAVGPALGLLALWPLLRAQSHDATP
jgi:MFS transporter, DHA1 family, inner membrane transport protein